MREAEAGRKRKNAGHRIRPAGGRERTSPLAFPWRLNERTRLQKKKKKCVAFAVAGQQIVALRLRCLARRSEREEHCESVTGGGEEGDNNDSAGTKKKCVCGAKEGNGN